MPTKAVTVWTVLALLFCLFVPTVAQAGKLQSVRNEVWRSPAPQVSSGPTRSASIAPSRFVAPRPVPTVRFHRTAVSRPLFVNPHPYRTGTQCVPGQCTSTVVLQSVPEGQTVQRFAAYPYEDGGRGYVLRVRPEAKHRYRWASGRVGLEGSYVMGGVWRLGGTLDLHVWRVGLVSELHGYAEPQSVGHVLYYGSSHATFDLIMFPRVQFRLGPGVTALLDGGLPGQGIQRYAIGPSLMGGLDVYARKPVVVSLRADRGRLPSVDTFSVRGTVGGMIGRIEVYAGYDYRRIGNSTSLHGPIGGLRAWF